VLSGATRSLKAHVAVAVGLAWHDRRFVVHDFATGDISSAGPIENALWIHDFAAGPAIAMLRRMGTR
jgi:hypothetical protein